MRRKEKNSMFLRRNLWPITAVGLEERKSGWSDFLKQKLILRKKKDKKKATKREKV